MKFPLDFIWMNECFALMHVCVSCTSWNWSYAQQALGIELRSSVRTSAVHCWAISPVLTIPFLIFHNIDILPPVLLRFTLFYGSFTGTSPWRPGHLCFAVLWTFLPLSASLPSQLAEAFSITLNRGSFLKSCHFWPVTIWKGSEVPCSFSVPLGTGCHHCMLFRY